jgi:hypothetical protein
MRSRFTGLLTLAVLFASGAAPGVAHAVPVARAPVFTRLPPTRAVLYIGDQSSVVSAVDIATGQIIEQLPYPMGPNGLEFGSGAGVAVDAQNNLYVGYVFDNGEDYPGKTIIYAYPPGQSQWSYKIAAGCCLAPTLAVSSRGELAEAIPDFASCCSASFSFIKPDKRYQRYSPYIHAAASFAFDDRDTCWVESVTRHGKVELDAIPRGSDVPHVVSLNPAQPFGPLLIDRHDNVLIAANAQTLNAYNAQGNRVYSVTISGASSIDDIALSSDGTRLYVAGTSSNGVLVYPFPSGGAPVATLGAGLSPYQIAVGAI